MRAETNLLHDAGLALGESDVAARLVADELDLDLAALAAALLVVVIVVVGRGSAGALNAAGLANIAVAIADGMRVVELGGRGLVVLIGDVGHFSVRVSRKTKKAKWWRCCFERCADGLDLIWRRAERSPFVAETWLGVAWIEFGVPAEASEEFTFNFYLLSGPVSRVWHAHRFTVRRC